MIVNFTLKSPISHGAFGDENLGNYSAFRRLPIIADGEVKNIPVLSGNSIRGTMRRVIMRELYDTSGFRFDDRLTAEFGMTKSKRAWDRLYATLFGGGTIDNVEVNINAGELRELRAALPPLSLFGSALYSTLLAGMMNIGFAFPLCAETISAGLWRGADDSLRNSAELLTDIGLTRHIDRENADPEETGVKPMPYQVEALIPGTKMQAEITFAPMATDIERHCAAHAIKLIRTLGGKASVGFGEISIDGFAEPDDLYVEWLKDSHYEQLIGLAKQVI